MKHFLPYNSYKCWTPLGNYVFLFLVISLFLNTGCTNKLQKRVAQEQIQELKEGCLVVRLLSNEKNLLQLEQLGYIEKVTKERQRIAKQNESILHAFEEVFDFCPVYFINSEDSKKLTNNKNKRDIFFTGAMAATTIPYDYMLTAQYGQIRQDTTAYYKEAYNYVDKKGRENRSAYWGSPNIPLTAIVVLSDQFVQLYKPFPYYSRKHRFILSISDRQMIRTLNRRFHRYYKRVKKKKTRFKEG